MSNKKIILPVAILGLLFSAMIACKPSDGGSSIKSEESPSSQSVESKPSSEKPSSESKSSVAPTPTPDPTQAAVTQTATADPDGKGETITWNAQDANKEADGFNSSGKFSSSGSYVKFTFEASMAMRARLFVTVENRSSNVWSRADQSGHQSIWYNWYDGDDWKYNVDVNGIRFDQSTMGTYEVNGEEIPMKELVYTDFLADGASTLEAPWFEFDVLEGRNTIRIERNLGYSVNMKSFKVVGRAPGVGPYVPEVEPEGYTVTFEAENCKVLVFNTKQYETETPVEATSCKARDETGKVVEYDPDDIELQPQVSFKVVCDEGYSVNATNVEITGTYKNLKQNPDSKEGQENIFRVTKVQTNLTIKITAVKGEQAIGYKVTFVTTNCSVKVYVGPRNADGTNLDTPEDGVYYARSKDGTFEISFTTPQINFEVVCEDGYEFVPVIGDDNKVDFIQGDYNKFQVKTDDLGSYYNMTKIASDLTITIVAAAVAR